MLSRDHSPHNNYTAEVSSAWTAKSSLVGTPSPVRFTSENERDMAAQY